MRTLAGAEAPVRDRLDATPRPRHEPQVQGPCPGRAARRLEARRQRRLRLACASVLAALVAASGAALDHERTAGGGGPATPHPPAAQAPHPGPSGVGAQGGR
jgi:hypothetical protein